MERRMNCRTAPFLALPLTDRKEKQAKEQCPSRLLNVQHQKHPSLHGAPVRYHITTPPTHVSDLLLQLQTYTIPHTSG